MTSKEFSLLIEKVVKEKPDLTYMEAILWYCEENDIEVESAGKMITKSLKEKITLQASEAKLLKQEHSVARLPV